MSIRAFVPSFSQVQDEQGRQYTVYHISVCVNDKNHRLEKRYSDFHSLHKQLKKMVEAPYFPPKRVKNQNPKFLEQRRQALEKYLQGLLSLWPVPKALTTFLNVFSSSPDNSCNLMDYEQSNSMEENHLQQQQHQPVLTFFRNSFLRNNSRDNAALPDIVAQGVLHGLYTEPPGINERD